MYDLIRNMTTFRIYGAQWLSDRVLDLRPKSHGFTGVTGLWSMSKTHLSKLITGSTQEDLFLFN